MGFIVYDKNDDKPTARSIDTFGPYFVEQCVAAHAHEDIYLDRTHLSNSLCAVINYLPSILAPLSLACLSGPVGMC